MPKKEKISLQKKTLDFAERIRWRTAEKIFEELEKLFLKNKGDSVANFHTFLIKDYDKFKVKFLQEKVK